CMYRPACRRNHTGVRSTGLRRHARTNRVPSSSGLSAAEPSTLDSIYVDCKISGRSREDEDSLLRGKSKAAQRALWLTPPNTDARVAIFQANCLVALESHERSFQRRRPVRSRLA